ncbi:hypothetical protein AO382_1129 [Moraxella catarrhalis]|uniref:Uncharacterized protein n=1 Tax=Moraxella catarrhalis TaxID=480 RepID=A0A7Z0UYF0_MORCA|nr:hypothetical protein AO382_1129 [Moraxella catarrhalis]
MIHPLNRFLVVGLFINFTNNKIIYFYHASTDTAPKIMLK